jgi:glycosyltransferase involved in cell wall biosynthesis
MKPLTPPSFTTHRRPIDRCKVLVFVAAQTADAAFNGMSTIESGLAARLAPDAEVFFLTPAYAGASVDGAPDGVKRVLIECPGAKDATVLGGRILNPPNSAAFWESFAAAASGAVLALTGGRPYCLVLIDKEAAPVVWTPAFQRAARTVVINDLLPGSNRLRDAVRAANARADAAIHACAQWQKIAACELKLPAREYLLCPLGFEPKMLPDVWCQARLRASLGLVPQNDWPVFLASGAWRDDDQKGWATLVASLPELLRLPALFILADRDADTLQNPAVLRTLRAARRLAADHPGRVYFGPVNYDDSLSLAAAALAPSNQEPWGVAPLEAASAGVPVIGTRMGCMAEDVWHAGINCFTLNAGEPGDTVGAFRKAVTAATGTFHRAPGEFAGIRAQARATAARFTWPAVLPQYRRILRVGACA